MKILHVEPNRYPTDALDQLHQVGELDLIECHDQDRLLALARQKPYEAIFVKIGLLFDVELMDAMPSLRYIITPTTGLNHIDLVEAEKRKITVFSLKGETTLLDTIKSTAEHTWALLLMLIRHMQEATADVEAGHWRREPFLAGELDGKTLGILGLGRLGRIVAGYGHAFGMNLQAYDTDASVYQTCPHPVQQVTLQELFASSDILSVHIPSTPANRHFVSASLLAHMPPHSILINTARGEVIQEQALLQSLQNKALAGVALDVLDGDSAWAEMVPGRHALIDYAKDHRNLIITPHMGGYGRESIERTRRFITKKFTSAILF